MSEEKPFDMALKGTGSSPSIPLSVQMVPAEAGGFLVFDPTWVSDYGSVRAFKPLFAGELEPCLSYIRGRFAPQAAAQ